MKGYTAHSKVLLHAVPVEQGIYTPYSLHVTIRFRRTDNTLMAKSERHPRRFVPQTKRFLLSVVVVVWRFGTGRTSLQRTPNAVPARSLINAVTSHRRHTASQYLTKPHQCQQHMQYEVIYVYLLLHMWHSHIRNVLFASCGTHCALTAGGVVDLLSICTIFNLDVYYVDLFPIYILGAHVCVCAVWSLLPDWLEEITFLSTTFLYTI